MTLSRIEREQLAAYSAECEQQALDAIRAQLRALVAEEERVVGDTTNTCGQRECGICGSTLHDLYHCTPTED